MKTIITAILILCLSGCHLSLIETLVLDAVLEITYDHTLGTLPEITPEKVREAEKVIDPDRENGR